MRYFPALVFGLLLFVMVNFAFSISAEYSPILNYLKSIPNLNSNSGEYWLLGLHDSIIVILISLISLVAYKLILPKSPFNLFAALLIQLPIVILNLVSPGVTLNFSSTYHSATSIVNLISFVSIGLVFFVLIAYNKHLNRDK